MSVYLLTYLLAYLIYRVHRSTVAQR